MTKSSTVHCTQVYRCRMQSIVASTALGLTVLLMFLNGIDGHAYLSSPKSRNFVARLPPFTPATEYCPHCLSGGGPGEISGGETYPYPETITSSARHGLCGDPALSNQRYLSTGDVQATYESSSIVTFEVTVSTHHRGVMRFFLCDLSTTPDNQVTQECLFANPLERDPSDVFISPPDSRPEYNGRYYLEPRCAKDLTDSVYTHPLEGPNSTWSYQQGQKVRMRYKLPENLTCTQCVLQWFWVTGNTCNIPGIKTHTYPSTFSDCSGDGPGAGWYSSVLSDCGESYPEEFWYYIIKAFHFFN